MKRLLLLILSILLLAPLAHAGGFTDFSAFSLDWSDGNNSRLAFYSPLTSTDSILNPQRAYPGTAATFSRASAQYITDFEGVVRKVESESVAVEGSRVVTNLLTYSEDLSNAVWIVTGTATKGDGNVINFAAANDSVQQTVTTTASVGSKAVVRVTLSGLGTTGLQLKRSGSGTLENTVKTVTLTAAPTTYSISHTILNTGQTGFVFLIYKAAGSTATSVTVHNAQLENVTAQSNQNPGEYIPTTSAAVTKCFSTTNGNTVDADGVVTEATGTALPQSYSERANSTAYSLNDKIQVSGWWYYCTTAGTSDSSAPTFPQGKAGTQTVTDGSVVWTIGGRLLLGYVSEPASTNKVTAYGIIPADTLGSELSSGSLTIGQKYQITARTDANFVADGAADNVVGTQFVATAATVTLDAGDKVKRVQWGAGEKSFHNGSAFVQNITGLTLSGDTAAVLSIVTDQTEIENAGLAGINPGFKVYKLDNSAGSGTATVAVFGTTGNTNAHSIRVTARKQAGSGSSVLQLLSGTGATAIPGSVYSEIVSANLTPSGTTQTLNVVAGIGDTIYFLLPQLEERPYATSVMPTAGATTTRSETLLSFQSAGNIPVNNYTILVEATAKAAQTQMIFGCGVAENRVTFAAYQGSVLGARLIKAINSTIYGANLQYTQEMNKTIKALARVSSTTGVTPFISGMKGATNSSAIADINPDTNFFVGSSYAGVTNSFIGYYRNFKIYKKTFSDEKCQQLTQ